MTIPNTTKEDLVKAMNDFDLNQRSHEEWNNWKNSKRHKHAINHNGKL